MNYKKSLFIFRRDLRIVDNKGLYEALELSDEVIPCFIFDPRQVGNENKYRSWNAIQFMIESLKELDEAIRDKGGKLYLFHDDPVKVVAKLIKSEKINAVFVNRDYTPFSAHRDTQIHDACITHGVDFIQSNDSLLIEPEDIVTGQGDPYSMFTPFYKKAVTYSIDEPVKKRTMNFYSKPIDYAHTTSLYKTVFKGTPNKNLYVKGGRTESLKILKHIKDHADYKKERDIPSIPTTGLSAHNKFGTVSIREVYHAFKEEFGLGSVLVQQLFWRDFFTHVAYHSPFVFGHSYKSKYDGIEWNRSKKDFQKWCEGKTGFPIVDAGMRQLNETGFMHNRVRMIVGSFLTKDLLIDWRWGEKYFAQKLIDYDPAVNNGNWQWVASTGCDAQPYFRIFNPWTQQKKFDPECEYIKTWVPELQKLDSKVIHNWFKSTSPRIEYPRPILDHKIAAAHALKAYKKV